MIVSFQLIFIISMFVQVSLHDRFYGFLCASLCLVYWLFNTSTFITLILILLQPSSYTLMFTVTLNFYFNLYSGIKLRAFLPVLLSLQS